MSAIAGVLERMEGLLAGWERRRDRRAVFVRSYRAVTARMARAIADGDFEDGAWVERLDVAFAEEYFQAVESFDHGTGRVPECWRLAFELAAHGRTTVLQDLALGMNAHILHDLPIALYKLGLPGVDRDRRRRDHDRVDEVLEGLIDVIQEEVSAHYSFVLRFLDRVTGLKDELLTDAGIRVSRAQAWTSALELLDAPDAGRAAVLAALDRKASATGRLLVPQPAGSARLVSRLRAWDRALAGYWRRLGRHA